MKTDFIMVSLVVVYFQFVVDNNSNNTITLFFFQHNFCVKQNMYP